MSITNEYSTHEVLIEEDIAYHKARVDGCDCGCPKGAHAALAAALREIVAVTIKDSWGNPITLTRAEAEREVELAHRAIKRAPAQRSLRANEKAWNRIWEAESILRDVRRALGEEVEAVTL